MIILFTGSPATAASPTPPQPLSLFVSTFKCVYIYFYVLRSQVQYWNLPPWCIEWHQKSQESIKREFP